MSPIDDELLRTWHRHDTVDRAFLRTLERTDLSLPTPGGGWTIEQQIAHIGAYWGPWKRNPVS